MSALGVARFETTLNDALSLGPRALSWVEQGRTPALISAAFEADALVLGSLQREDTLRERSSARFVNVVRRATTGTEAQLSGRVLYHALALPHVNALYADASPRTLLNRNLRAILRGYTAAGVPLRYFGTEVLALLGHPVALVGYDMAASGAVLIEVLLGLDEPCVVRPALKREPPASLCGVMKRELDAAELLERAEQGIVSRLEAQTLSVELASSVGGVGELPGETPRAVAIPLGVVEAVTTPSVRFTGDLLVGTAALARVETAAQAALDAGQPLTEALLSPSPLDGAKPADLLAALTAA